jgi:hypothetical protein
MVRHFIPLSLAVALSVALAACGDPERRLATPASEPTLTPTAAMPFGSPTPVGTVRATPTRASPVSTPSPTPLPGARFVFEYGARTSVFDRNVVKGALELTEAYIRATTGFSVPETTVYVFAGLDEFLRLYTPVSELVHPVDIARRLSFTIAEAHYRQVLVFTGSDRWRQSNDVQRFRLPAHEYFHVIQMELLGSERVEEIAQTPVVSVHAGGPVWLFEGAAEYVSWRVIDDIGLADMQAHLAAMAANARGEPSRLSALEAPLDYTAAADAALAHALLAVDLLMQQRPLGDLLRFYDGLGRGLGWQESFLGAFGVSASEFYSQYDAFALRDYRR